jgi:hypothetical protein
LRDWEGKANSRTTHTKRTQRIMQAAGETALPEEMSRGTTVNIQIT